MSNAPTAEFQVEDLFRQHSVREFFERHYLKLPFASAQGCESACRLADWETCVRLAADARADVLIGRGGDHWPGPLPQDDAELRRILEEGYTLGVRHVDRLDERLGHLAASFCAAFAALVDEDPDAQAQLVAATDADVRARLGAEDWQAVKLDIAIKLRELAADRVAIVQDIARAENAVDSEAAYVVLAQIDAAAATIRTAWDRFRQIRLRQVQRSVDADLPDGEVGEFAPAQKVKLPCRLCRVGAGAGALLILLSL